MTCESALAGRPVPDDQRNRPQSRSRLIRRTRPADAALTRVHAALCLGTDAEAVIRLARTGIRPAARALLGRLFPTARTSAPRSRLAAGNPAGPQAGACRPCLVVPEGLEEYGWGLIDWRGLPGRVAVGLLRAADRIAREGHAVAFTGQEYQAGPELKVDGHLTVTRYLSSQPGLAATPGDARDLLATVVADTRGGTARMAVVCEQPDFGKEDASQVITGLRHQPGSPGTRGVDIYGYGWTVHA